MELGRYQVSVFKLIVLCIGNSNSLSPLVQIEFHLTFISMRGIDGNTVFESTSRMNMRIFLTCLISRNPISYIYSG